jgi:hypothetical protein
MSIQFLLARIEPYMPVVYILGNHDYYGSTIEAALASARRASNGSNLMILENETAIFGDVRIVGATLWTDFEVPHGGPGPQLPLPARRSVAIQVAQRYMLDFHEIFSSPAYGQPRLVSPEELLDRHGESHAYIDEELANPFDGRTVVLTHHAPSPRSLHPGFLGHPSNGAFASDLSLLIERRQPDLWVHGHVHKCFDYMQRQTRIICNPRGYRREYSETGFRPGLVVDI